MLIVVAVHTQQFPVTAIVRIVVVIMIAMMYREFGQIAVIEFAHASTANPGIEL